MEPGKTAIENLRRSGAEIIEMGEYRSYLFLDDDHIVSGLDGVDYIYGVPEKHGGNPVVKPDRPWEKDFAYVSIHHDEEEDLFKMWYWIYNDPGHPATGYATSMDGLEWEKPVLNLEEYDGSRENNICFVSRGPPGRRAQTNHVFKDYSDPDPDRLYKMVLDKVDFRGRGISFAFSPDGIRWRQMGYNVLLGGFDTQNVVLWDDRAGLFRAYLRLWTYGKRHVRMATSRDLYHWTEPVWIHGPDERDPPEMDIYTPGAVKYPAGNDVYVMLNSVYDHGSDRIWCQLSLSRDGVNWRRHREPFIPIGEEGAWDGAMIFPAPAIPVKDDLMYFYYRGEDRLHGEKRESYCSGVGCATLRKDGFVGLRAGDKEGAVTTRPLAFSRGGGEMPTRGRLYLNLDAARGRALVEFCDLEGRPIDGFTRNDCDPIGIDSTAVRVSWNGNPVIEGLHGIPVVLRFFLRNSTLYSMGFRRSGDVSDPLERKLAAMERAYKEAPLGDERRKIQEEMADFLSGPGSV